MKQKQRQRSKSSSTSVQQMYMSPLSTDNLTDETITNCLAMSEREKENQHRWLKMKTKHAAIQVRLERDHRNQQRRITSNSNEAWGENRGGRGQKGLLSASANLTGTQQSVWGECGEKHGGGRPEAPPIKTRIWFISGQIVA
eukprot:scaffold24938_cov115-Skeletonema_dohrnii-CCMP3373.AAC.4